MRDVHKISESDDFCLFVSSKTLLSNKQTVIRKGSSFLAAIQSKLSVVKLV